MEGARGRPLEIWALQGTLSPAAPGAAPTAPASPPGEKALDDLKADLKRDLEGRKGALHALCGRLGIASGTVEAVVEGIVGCDARRACLGLADALGGLGRSDREALWRSLERLLPLLASWEGVRMEPEGGLACKVHASNPTVASLVIARGEGRGVRFVLRGQADLMDEHCTELPAASQAPLRPTPETLEEGIRQTRGHVDEQAVADQINADFFKGRSKTRTVGGVRERLAARSRAAPRFTLLVTPDREDLWPALKQAVARAFPDLRLVLIVAGPDEHECIAESLREAFEVVKP